VINVIAIAIFVGT